MGIKVNIVGVGLGQEEFLTQKAKEILIGAQKVYTTHRIGSALAPLLQEVVEFKVSEILTIIKESKENIVIMVSGDTGFYSLAKTIQKGLQDQDIQLEFTNGISSMQYFMAKLNRGYENVVLASAHGRKANLVALCSYNHQVFALTGGESKVSHILETLNQAGMGFLQITIGENLGSPREKITAGQVLEFVGQEFSPLSVVLLENKSPANPHSFIRDEELERGNAPMTKEEIRHLSVTRLDIQPEDVVYDIGAGTGSVTLEMAKRANGSMVYAIEQKEDALALVKTNMKKLGIYNIHLVHGKAPEHMEDFPPANKVFIGGSGKNMGSILDTIVDKHKQSYEQLVDKSKYQGPTAMDIVINTITLESLTEANKILENPCYQNVEYMSISSAKSKKVGGYHMMMANNPIYIISATYKFEWL